MAGVFLVGVHESAEAQSTDDEVERRLELRRNVNESPDAEKSMALARSIEGALERTAIEWHFQPDDRGFGGGDRIATPLVRADEKENHATLAEALEQCFESAAISSPLRRRAASALARLSLVRGDLEGMNRWLEKSGEPPIDLVDLGWSSRMHAPPKDWRNLSATWGLSAPELRSGTEALRFHMQYEGSPLRGVHLVLRAYEPDFEISTGFVADTLAGSTAVLGRREGNPSDRFGYEDDQTRKQTRYAVTDPEGRASFEALPAGRYRLELVVPTGNLQDPATQWQCFVQDHGRFVPFGHGLDSPLGEREAARALEVKDGSDTEFPTIEVRRARTFTRPDAAPVENGVLALEWPAASPSEHHALIVRLVAPDPTRRAAAQARWTQSLQRWEIPVEDGRAVLRADEGLGAKILLPGNLLVLDVEDRAEDRTLLDVVAPIRVHVPWSHRESRFTNEQIPVVSMLPASARFALEPSPGAAVERYDAWIEEHPDDFFVEYVEFLRSQALVSLGRKDEAATLASRLEENVVPGSGLDLLMHPRTPRDR